MAKVDSKRNAQFNKERNNLNKSYKGQLKISYETFWDGS